MKNFSPLIAFLLILIFGAPPVFACGLFEVTPVFEYEHAPEDPYQDFAAGKLGIVKPTLRRAVLFAAYRYLNNGAFGAGEQKALVEVWRAEFNNEEFADNDVTEAVKTWLAARKQVASDEEKLPAIYGERGGENYDYFPNCTKSAFVTAAETLNSRVASYGANDANVKDWLAAQDTVFANCASGVRAVPETSADAVDWLKKDRAYQSAAADFYSLNFQSAKQKFSRIAADAESPWQTAAQYLVGRTLVREASLTNDETARLRIYAEAEIELQIAVAANTKFSDAAQKLLNLVKYRIRPLERARELAGGLAFSSNDNLRQDLIDYTWLLDKIEKDALEAEENRKKPVAEPSPSSVEITEKNKYEQIQDGEIIDIRLEYQKPSKPDVYDGKSATLYFKPDATDQEIFAAFETEIKRGLSDEETAQILQNKKQSLAQRDAFLAGNFRLKNNRQNDVYAGAYYGDEKFSGDLIPESLRQDDLTDWLYSYQLAGADAYAHALERWRETDSDAWLIAALSKAENDSPQIKFVVEKAARVSRDSPAFPTVAFHLARLLLDANKTVEARRFLDDVLNSTLDLPVSTRNQFLAQRARIANGFDEFLRFGQRKAFGFCLDFDYCGSAADFIRREKAVWLLGDHTEQTEADFDRETAETYKTYLTWEARAMLDARTIKIFNLQFPLQTWLAAARSSELPDYTRRDILLKIWTRAVLLENVDIENKVAPEIVELYPALKARFEPYLNQPTALAKRRAALWILLKTPELTPFLSGSIPPEIGEEIATTDQTLDDFTFATNWWCEYSINEYDEKGEVKPFAPEPLAFLSPADAQAAKAERARFVKIGNAPQYLARKVFEWQAAAPRDKRIPEALYIAARANGWTKYGCGDNLEMGNKAGLLLQERYPRSSWTIRLLKEDQENQ